MRECLGLRTDKEGEEGRKEVEGMGWGLSKCKGEGTCKKG